MGTKVEPLYLTVPACKLELFMDWMQLGYLNKHASFSVFTDRFFVRPWQQHTFDRAQLIDLFDVGSLFICMPATDWVLGELEKLNLGPAEKLGIALKLGIRRWVERAAIKKLFSRPAYSYTPQEREDMGYQVVSILSNGQLRILTERTKRAVIPPPVNNSLGALECPYFGVNHDKSRCAQSWDTLWILDVGKKLIHPVDPMPFGDAVTFIRSLPFQGVTPHCWDMGLDSLNGSFGEIDQVILDNVVAKLIGLLPMSAYSA